LRFIHALPLPAIVDPQIIGIDDWAWKRRERYGAIVVDLERNRPIALLPDRSQKTAAQWLKCYPTITIVARDRGKEFAAAITEALPHAKHVADRWHLAKNLTEYLDKVVSRRWKQLTGVVDEAELPPEPVPVSSRVRRPRQSVGEARYQQVLALQKAGRWATDDPSLARTRIWCLCGTSQTATQPARLVNAISAGTMGGWRAQRLAPLGGVEGSGLHGIES
jgi:hypothetical protein